MTSLQDRFINPNQTVEEPEKKRELGNTINSFIDNQGVRDAAGATYEITSGLAFDAITTPLGWAPPVYAALNFGEGSISNVIAQKIRGRKWNEIDWNEVFSSGVLGIVPLSQLRAAKYLKKPVAETVEKVVGKQDTLQRYIASGAITGGGDVTIRSGLAGEAPSPENLAAGTVSGAVIGGTLSPLLRQLSKTVTGIVQQKRVSKAEAELLSKQLELQERDFTQLTKEDGAELKRLLWNVGKEKGEYEGFDTIEDYESMKIDLQGNLNRSIDGLPMPGGEKHLISEKKLKTLKGQTTFQKLSAEDQRKAIDIIDPIDEYAEKARKDTKSRYDPSAPTKGAHDSQGKPYPRKFITADGKELAVSFRGGQWKLIDDSLAKEAIKRRYVWAHSYSSKAAKKEQAFTWRGKAEENTQAKRVLDQLIKSDDPADQHLYSRLVGGTQPFQIEHIQNQDSWVWKEIKNAKGEVVDYEHKYKTNADGTPVRPGDDENLRLVGIYDFKYLKDGIEKKMKAEGYTGDDGYHLDMDKDNNIIVISNKTLKRVHPKAGPQYLTYIHRSTDPKDGWKEFLNIIEGGGQAPRPRAEDVRRTFAEWELNPEGGKLMAEESRASKSKRVLDIEDHYTEIKKIQGKILKLDHTNPKDLEKKLKLDEELEIYREELLEFIRGNHPFVSQKRLKKKKSN